MRKFVFFLALFCGVTLGLCAVEPEEPILASVIINADEGGEDMICVCEASWDVMHLTSEEGEPLWKALISLESTHKAGQPFTSKVLDDAVLALAKDIADDDKKEDSDKQYTSLRQGMVCLTQKNGWIWYFNNVLSYLSDPFVPGAVRLMLTCNTPDQMHLPAQGRFFRQMFEGFPAQSGHDLKPDWLPVKDPYECSDTMD